MRVLFYLPGAGGGGAHSVVQEATGMHRLGTDVVIAISRQMEAAFQSSYPELPMLGVPVRMADDAAELAACAADRDVACATTFESVYVLRAALDLMARPPRAAYYVQDYEPLFCAPWTERWHRARASYSALDGAILFAKTDWLCAIVEANSGIKVHQVKPSLDHAVYFPAIKRDASKKAHIVVSAMLRPSTRRRAPLRTVRVLEHILSRFGVQVEATVFGATTAELADHAIHLPPRVFNRGRLSRAQVADVLRGSDLFLDLSDYQAFGRTGIEAMACGCVPLLPVLGGASLYARHKENAFLVDTRSDVAVLSEVEHFINMSSEQRSQMRAAAIATASEYSIEDAARSELSLFSNGLSPPARV